MTGMPEPGEVKAGCEEAVKAALAAEREQLAACMDELAANYPEDVFPPRSSSIDAISGTAMRLAYSYAARYIREGYDRD